MLTLGTPGGVKAASKNLTNNCQSSLLSSVPGRTPEHNYWRHLWSDNRGMMGDKTSSYLRVRSLLLDELTMALNRIMRLRTSRQSFTSHLGIGSTAQKALDDFFSNCLISVSVKGSNVSIMDMQDSSTNGLPCAKENGCDDKVERCREVLPRFFQGRKKFGLIQVRIHDSYRDFRSKFDSRYSPTPACKQASTHQGTGEARACAARPRLILASHGTPPPSGTSGTRAEVDVLCTEDPWSYRHSNVRPTSDTGPSDVTSTEPADHVIRPPTPNRDRRRTLRDRLDLAYWFIYVHTCLRPRGNQRAMTSVLNRRHHAADPGSKSVKYTPCSKGEQTDEEELDEIAITTPSVRSRSPRDSGQRSPHTPDRPEEGVTANGPRALPGSVGYGTTASDRTKLIAERLINRSESPIFVSSNRSSSVQRTSSKQSIFEMVSNKIESVKNGGRSKGQSSADDVSTMGYINKAHVPEPPTPKEIRKARKKEIEERFGKRSADCGDRFTDVSDKEGCKWTFVFDPSGRFAYWWSMVVSIAFLYNFWVIIYRFALEEINASTKVIWFTLDYLADFLYVLDVAFHFRTGYLEGGVLQTDATKLRIHYLNSTMFYIDCLCLLPLDMLYLSIGYKSMLRCFRLVKIYRFWAFLDRTERHTNYPNMVRTITLLHYLFAIYHWNACLMYMVMKRLDNNNWVVPNDNADILEKYLHALYWSTLTLTMIGDLPMPRTKGEYVFVIIEFVFGLLLFSTILGHVANIVTGISSARRDFQGKRNRKCFICRFFTMA
ncbi:hypothetical protein LSH36_169g03028 [Paralvinella palmiformis]|uniref:Ion transport domain-containing protein n=1 Tax=Paralvinella palmiformis TaxID=53620 RepID=A0AAD9JUI4_9ANNE|nr:hypothetical protein LSH36_169g03028 [Paralvinella palmiformis]